jgi:hypothetical protein
MALHSPSESYLVRRVLRVSTFEMMRFPPHANRVGEWSGNFRAFTPISQYFGNLFDSQAASIEGQFAPS